MNLNTPHARRAPSSGPEPKEPFAGSRNLKGGFPVPSHYMANPFYALACAVLVLPIGGSLVWFGLFGPGHQMGATWFGLVVFLPGVFAGVTGATRLRWALNYRRRHGEMPNLSSPGWINPYDHGARKPSGRLP